MNSQRLSGGMTSLKFSFCQQPEEIIVIHRGWIAGNSEISPHEVPKNQRRYFASLKVTPHLASEDSVWKWHELDLEI
jgi:hypothetical protein